MEERKENEEHNMSSPDDVYQSFVWHFIDRSSLQPCLMRIFYLEKVIFHRWVSRQEIAVIWMKYEIAGVIGCCKKTIRFKLRKYNNFFIRGLGLRILGSQSSTKVTSGALYLLRILDPSRAILSEFEQIKGVFFCCRKCSQSKVDIRYVSTVTEELSICNNMRKQNPGCFIWSP